MSPLVMPEQQPIRKAMISSTARDLPEHRKQVLETDVPIAIGMAVPAPHFAGVFCPPVEGTSATWRPRQKRLSLQ
ncbi:MAG: hypothetical protein HY842_03995 [Bacteroidetes bacterium]|nr:hypothetical protein [Bacteroidota bacterium]